MINNNIQNPMWELEIRVLSCEGLNLMISHPSSSSFSSWFFSFIFTPLNHKPTHFISITKLPDHKPKVYNTRLLEGEGVGEAGVLRVPADSTFLSHTQSFLYLQIYYKRWMFGPRLVGSCLIPATDIGPPPSYVKCLSYRLRGRDGCVGGGIVNLSIHLKNMCGALSHPPAIGIPIGKV